MSRSPSRGPLRVSLRHVFAAAVFLSILGCPTTEGPSCVIDVCPPSSVTVTPASAELLSLGQTTQLSASVRDEANNLLTDPVTWASSNTGVASVDASGLVTAVANGSASITATAGSASGSASVTVSQRAVSAQLDVVSITISGIGESESFGVTVQDALGSEITDAVLDWSSDDASVATVDASGVVTAVDVGSTEVEVAATAGGNTVTDRGLVTVLATLEIVIEPLSHGVVGAAYSDALTAVGGDGTYTWSITAGSLPAGLALDGSTGAITGTPTTTGQSTFTVRVSSGDGQEASSTMSIEVFDQLTVTTTSLPDAVLGIAYAHTLEAAGGGGSVSWGLESGTLPGGLVLNVATGEISGTPSTAGSTTFVVRATGNSGDTDTQELTLVVTQALAITNSALPGGGTGAAYSTTVEAAGGVGELTWSLASGVLPDGLSLDAATGTISGTPSTAGAFAFILQVNDEAGQEAAASFTITIAAQLQVTTAALPNAMATVDYGIQVLTAAGGDGSYSWALASASDPLPDGLSLTTTGAISGTPTTPGGASFTVEVTSGDGQLAEKALELVVDSAAYQFVIRCRDHMGADVACAYWNDVRDITGDTLTYPPDSTFTLLLMPPDSVFRTWSEVGGPAGFHGEVTIDLVGQGGEHCGGTEKSLSFVTVVPNSGCPGGGVVSDPQEAIYLVQDGGAIEFQDGEHEAKRLMVPRDDITLRAASGAAPVILAGSGTPDAYDGPAFLLLGAGDLVVQALTFRSPATGGAGFGLVTARNSIYGEGAYTSVVVDDVVFENLRLGVVVLGSSAPGAQVVIQNSDFVRNELKPQLSRGVLLIANDSSVTPNLSLQNNWFESTVSDPMDGVLAVDYGPDVYGNQVFLDAQGNTLIGCSHCLQAGSTSLAHGSIIAGNTITDPRPGAIGVNAGVTHEGDTITIRENQLLGSFVGADRAVETDYGFARGIVVNGNVNAHTWLFQNTITGAFWAVETGPSGSTTWIEDQVADSVYSPLHSYAASEVTMTNSDLTNWIDAYTFDNAIPYSTGSLTCNWWGDAAGPGDTSDVHTPWAIAPIANGAGGACTGSGSAPSPGPSDPSPEGGALLPSWGGWRLPLPR